MTNKIFTSFEGMPYAMLTSKSVQVEPRFTIGFTKISGRPYSSVVTVCTLETSVGLKSGEITSYLCKYGHMIFPKSPFLVL